MAAKNILLCFLFLNISVFSQNGHFAHVKGQDIYIGNSKLLIKGTNLGNWLNPEGYMFSFDKVSSYRLINDAFSEMVGPAFIKNFWKTYQENYITREDIFFIKKTGMNTVRIPFHYKLFSNEEFMGGTARGFEILDKVVAWCHEAGLYVILDMHDAPGGQTGDNIDDGYGYPWLLLDEDNQKQFLNIWTDIAKHYNTNQTIIGYDLLNEPIAHYFKEDLPKLNTQLEPLYIRTTNAIRTVDRNHIIFLGGAQWDSNFEVFKNWNFDENIAYTCHRYWSGTDKDAIQDFLNFRAKSNHPLYMGETGENTDEWVAAFRTTLEQNNIGWTFWPYKKMPEKSGMVSFKKPQGWDEIIKFTQNDRSSFAEVRDNRPPQEIAKNALNELLENIKFKNCKANSGYISALGMNP